MILKIFTDTIQLRNHRYTVLLQQHRIPDAGQLQELRRVNHATAKNHTAVCIYCFEFIVFDYLHAGGAIAGEQYASYQRPLLHCQILSGQSRFQITFGRTPARSVGNCHVHGTKTFLPEAVLVFGITVACLYTCINKCLKKRVLNRSCGYSQWPLAAVIRIFAAIPRFCFSEVRQTMCIGPTWVSGFFGPPVVVKSMAANIAHSID